MLNDTLAERYLTPLQPVPTGLQPARRLKGPVECLLFDIYGTLLISGSGDIGMAKNSTGPERQLAQLLAEYRIRSTPDALLKAYFDAIAREHERLRLKGVDAPEVQIDRIWQAVLETDDMDQVRRFALEFELLSNPVYPMPHLARLLDTARSNRLPMGIISNAQFYTPILLAYFLKADLTALGFKPDLIHYSYRSGYAKPSLHMFRLARDACEQAGIRTETVLYLGNDMRNDILPAARCGMQTALFAGDRRSLRLRSDDPACRHIKPDMVVTDLEQVIELIE